MSAKSKRIVKRTAKSVGVLAAALVGVYFYQPQRVDFFPKPAPYPNPTVDPDSAKLFAPGTRVAVVAAHPDDPEFFIGGILTELSRAGAKIAIVMCTDGDKAYYTRLFTDADQNRVVRRQEQIDAAKQYGAEVFFLQYPDGRLRANDDLIADVRKTLNEFKPEYVLAFDPIYPPKIQHSDHLQSGIAAAAAVPDVPTVKWLLQYSTHAANHYVDITSVWPVKEELLTIHKSQFNGKRLKMVTQMVGQRAQHDGAQIGVGYAEGLRCSRVHT